MKFKLKTALVDIAPEALSFEEVRSFLGEFLRKSPHGKRLWDVLVCLRGPDTGWKAMVDYEDGRDSAARQAREQRKLETGAIIRARLFPNGIAGASAKFNDDPQAVVKLPPTAEWDHYDAHAFEACEILKIPCMVGDQPHFVATSPSSEGSIIWQWSSANIVPIDDIVQVGDTVALRSWISPQTAYMATSTGINFRALLTPGVALDNYDTPQALLVLGVSGNHFETQPIGAASLQTGGWKNLTHKQASTLEQFAAKIGVKGAWQEVPGGLFSFEKDDTPLMKKKKGLK